MLNWKKSLIFLIIMLFVLSGCNNEEKTVEGIHKHLEETVLLEKAFENVQQPILDAEKEEQQIYEEIIKLSLEDYDQIKQLATKAITSANNRKKFISEEKSSIELAYKEFKLIEPLIKELKSEDIIKKSEDLLVKMKDRHESYLKLNVAYSKGIEMDIKLYELLQKKDVSITELEEHIDKLNKQYETIMTAKDEFNKETENFNKIKKAFYKVADLDVEIKY